MTTSASTPQILTHSIQWISVPIQTTKIITSTSTLNSSGNTVGSPQGVSALSSGKLDPGELIDPALLTETPGVRFTFDAGGGTTGTGTAQVPPSGPSLNANNPNLTFSGNPILSGNAFQVQNMLLNMNICVQCRASGHIVQTGNGFVFPITVQ